MHVVRSYFPTCPCLKTVVLGKGWVVVGYCLKLKREKEGCFVKYAMHDSPTFHTTTQ